VCPTRRSNCVRNLSCPICSAFREPFHSGWGRQQVAILSKYQAQDHRGVDLISDVLPFSRLWYDGPNAVANAIGYAEQYSRSHDAVISVYDVAGNVIDTHENAGEFKEP